MDKPVPIEIILFSDESEYLGGYFGGMGYSEIRAFENYEITVRTNGEGFKHLINLQKQWEAERYGNEGHD